MKALEVRRYPILEISAFRCAAGLLCLSWKPITILRFTDSSCGLRGVGGQNRKKAALAFMREWGGV